MNSAVFPMNSSRRPVAWAMRPMTSGIVGDHLVDGGGRVRRPKSQLVVANDRFFAGGGEIRLGGGRLIDETSGMLEQEQPQGEATAEFTR